MRDLTMSQSLHATLPISRVQAERSQAHGECAYDRDSQLPDAQERRLGSTGLGEKIEEDRRRVIEGYLLEVQGQAEEDAPEYIVVVDHSGDCS